MSIQTNRPDVLWTSWPRVDTEASLDDGTQEQDTSHADDRE